MSGDVIALHPPHLRHRHVLSPGGASLSTRYRGSGGVTGVIKEIDRRSIAGHEKGVLARAKVALDIDWMNSDEITQAIPPAFTEFIGSHLLAACGCLKPETHTAYADPDQQRPNLNPGVRTPQGGKGDGE